MIAKLELVLGLQYLLKLPKGKAKIDQKSKLGYALTYLRASNQRMDNFR